jgi:hypothetical protein
MMTWVFYEIPERHLVFTCIINIRRLLRSIRKLESSYDVGKVTSKSRRHDCNQALSPVRAFPSFRLDCCTIDKHEIETLDWVTMLDIMQTHLSRFKDVISLSLDSMMNQYGRL